MCSYNVLCMSCPYLALLGKDSIFQSYSMQLAGRLILDHECDVDPRDVHCLRLGLLRHKSFPVIRLHA